MRDTLTLALFDDPAPTVAPVTEPEAPTPTDRPPVRQWSEFFEENRRIPMLADRPWEYRGWLLYYRLLCEDVLPHPKRWDYWARTMMAGKVLEEDIPQVSLSHASERSAGWKHFNKLVELVEMKGRGWSSFNDLLRWMKYGFAIGNELPNFSPELHEQLYRQLNLQHFLEEPADYIGEWIAARHGNGWNPNAFYPTPNSVVEAMVRMQMTGADKTSTVMDPCCGSGRMLLHASNYSLRLYGQDIDRTMCDVTLINGILYAPWLAKPFPEEFFA